MLKELINLANHLDKIGLTKEANIIDEAIEKYAHGDLLEVMLLSEDGEFEESIPLEIFNPEDLEALESKEPPKKRKDKG